MSCKRIAAWIEQVADGSADPARRRETEAHCAECATCAAELAKSRHLLRLLGASPRREVSPAFEARVLSQVRQTETRPSLLSGLDWLVSHFEWRLRVPGAVGAAGLAVALIVALAVPPTATLEQRAVLTAAVEQHRQFSSTASETDWDSVDQSLRLGTGDLVIE